MDGQPDFREGRPGGHTHDVLRRIGRAVAGWRPGIRGSGEVVYALAIREGFEKGLYPFPENF